MQQALPQMNLVLQHVVSAITGRTGMTIIRAILAGQRAPQGLAQQRDPPCNHRAAGSAKPLAGTYRAAHLFA